MGGTSNEGVGGKAVDASQSDGAGASNGGAAGTGQSGAGGSSLIDAASDMVVRPGDAGEDVRDPGPLDDPCPINPTTDGGRWYLANCSSSCSHPPLTKPCSIDCPLGVDPIDPLGVLPWLVVRTPDTFVQGRNCRTWCLTTTSPLRDLKGFMRLQVDDFPMKITIPAPWQILKEWSGATCAPAQDAHCIILTRDAAGPQFVDIATTESNPPARNIIVVPAQPGDTCP
jgi:hypothetical protein